MIHSSSNHAGWCNVSLECGIPGATENLTVTWLSEGLPRELEQRGALGLAPSSRNLSLSLPLSQLNGSLTCRVSNPVDGKNATLLLQSVCPWRGEWDLWERLAENRAGHDWGTQGNHWDRGVLEGGHCGAPQRQVHGHTLIMEPERVPGTAASPRASPWGSSWSLGG